MQIPVRKSGILASLNSLSVHRSYWSVRVYASREAAVKVSAVIITYNEAVGIARTLSKLWWCDEVVIVDSGSTDSTVAICKELGCTVYTRTFTGFGEQKNYGVQQARNHWILCVDADEVLTDGLVDEIREALKAEDLPYAGFAMPRNLVFMNKVFRFGKESSSPVIRLFDRRSGSWDGAIVHEKVFVNGPVKQLQHKILHYSYHNYTQFLSKINLYSSLGAQKVGHNKPKNKAVVLLGVPFHFLRYYFGHRNFLNGYHGFAWSLLNTVYHFVKYLKLEELKRGSDEAAH